MSEWAPKRFWTEAAVKADPDGYGVMLDGKPVRTPGKNPLTMPTRAMAEKVAAEWDAVEKTIDPRTMPVTRAANSAIEKVAPQKAAVIEMLAAYGDTDLLCYRADHPEGLVARQAKLWDPALDWAAETLGARLEPRTGLMPVPQSPEALAKLNAELHKFDEFQLTAVHDLVMLTSSLVLGLAATRGWQTPEYIWSLSRVDEDWQEAQWGEDDEAQAAAAARKEGFLNAVLFFELCSAE
ncbi:ATP12 family chaperone protein [Chachezhania antarctica]|uniref:ATP12 family chaperone protein n=1 Tax=Chachezhania antarctica TaxID=2340860 RepID=UPI000EB34407|nr:ATP12 family protein [Chachezhania antarctica]